MQHVTWKEPFQLLMHLHQINHINFESTISMGNKKVLAVQLSIQSGRFGFVETNLSVFANFDNCTFSVRIPAASFNLEKSIFLWHQWTGVMKRCHMM